MLPCKHNSERKGSLYRASVQKVYGGYNGKCNRTEHNVTLPGFIKLQTLDIPVMTKKKVPERIKVQLLAVLFLSVTSR